MRPKRVSLVPYNIVNLKCELFSNSHACFCYIAVKTEGKRFTPNKYTHQAETQLQRTKLNWNSFLSHFQTVCSQGIPNHCKRHPRTKSNLGCMGEYSSKKSLFCCAVDFENSYFADRQNGQFLRKPWGRADKCNESKEKRLNCKKYTKFRMNFVQKAWKMDVLVQRRWKNRHFWGASRPQNSYLAEFSLKKLIIPPPPHPHFEEYSPMPVRNCLN